MVLDWFSVNQRFQNSTLLHWLSSTSPTDLLLVLARIEEFHTPDTPTSAARPTHRRDDPPRQRARTALNPNVLDQRRD